MSRERPEVREYVNSLKLSGVCSCCGVADGFDLEFDHIDPREKSFEISAGVARGFTLRIVKAELEVCQLMCMKCHKKKSRLERASGLTKRRGRVQKKFSSIISEKLTQPMTIKEIATACGIVKSEQTVRRELSRLVGSGEITVAFESLGRFPKKYVLSTIEQELPL